MSKEIFQRIFNELGITQSELSQLFGAPRNTISNYVRGNVQNVPASAVTLLCVYKYLKASHPDVFRELLYITRHAKRESIPLATVISEPVLLEGILKNAELKNKQ